jgi:hypothetical protein
MINLESVSLSAPKVLSLILLSHPFAVAAVVVVPIVVCALRSQS